MWCSPASPRAHRSTLEANRGTLMTGMRWARLQEDVDCKMRRGAWYRVTQVTGLNAIVEVNRQPLAVPSYAIEIVATPPRCWTVVPLPRRASRLAAERRPPAGRSPDRRPRPPHRPPPPATRTPHSPAALA